MAATKTTNTKATANKATKKVDTKAKAVKTETKKVDAKNTEKKNQTITIQEVVAMYADAGIKCYNPECKGNYRIMGSKKGSSLNLQKTRYIIYSTDTDYEAVEVVKDKYKDLVLVKGGNAQDHSRPNKVEFSAVDTLKALLKIYATNPENQVVATK